jgi:hypothetical protein
MIMPKHHHLIRKETALTLNILGSRNRPTPGRKALLATICGLALAATAVVYSPAMAASPGLSATGAGHFQTSGALRTFAFSAITHDDGTVTGQAQFNNRGLDLTDHVAVDCIVALNANTVDVGGIVTTSSNPTMVGTHVEFTAQSNGHGGQHDKLSLAWFPVSGCPTIAWPLFALDGGNITIHS